MKSHPSILASKEKYVVKPLDKAYDHIEKCLTNSTNILGVEDYKVLCDIKITIAHMMKKYKEE